MELQPVSQALSKSKELPKVLTDIIVRKYGVKIKELNFVAEAHSKQIRNLPIKESRGLVTGSLALLSVQYGATQKIDDHVLKECSKLVLTGFAHFSLSDLQEAYRQWATGDLGEVKGADMYGGVFNAANMGKVLKAYNKKRKMVLAAYLTEYGKLRDKNRISTKKRIAREEFDSKFPGLLEKAKDSFEHFSKIPLSWYNECLNRRLFTLSKEEKTSIYSIAEKLAHQFYTEELGRFKKERLFNKALGRPQEDIASRARVISKKLCVWKYVLLKNLPSVKV